jgi:hypothetical protein
MIGETMTIPARTRAQWVRAVEEAFGRLNTVVDWYIDWDTFRVLVRIDPVAEYGFAYKNVGVFVSHPDEMLGYVREMLEHRKRVQDES